MSDQPDNIKYIPLSEIVKEMIARPKQTPPPPIWVYDYRCPPNFQFIPPDPIITEDIDCEIIVPPRSIEHGGLPPSPSITTDPPVPLPAPIPNQ